MYYVINKLIQTSDEITKRNQRLCEKYFGDESNVQLEERISKRDPGYS